MARLCGRLVKPLWGFLSDAFPIAGYRRRSWLLMVNLIGRRVPTVQPDSHALLCALRAICVASVDKTHVLTGTLGWVGLGLLAFGPGTALLFLLLTNLGLAFGDVIVVRRWLQSCYTAVASQPLVIPRYCHGLQLGWHLQHESPVVLCCAPQDAIVVGMARDEPSERAGSLQSLCWGSRVGACSVTTVQPASHCAPCIRAPPQPPVPTSPSHTGIRLL